MDVDVQCDSYSEEAHQNSARVEMYGERYRGCADGGISLWYFDERTYVQRYGPVNERLRDAHHFLVDELLEIFFR